MCLRGMLIFGCSVALAVAAEKRPLQFRDIIELNEPSQPRISPDGTRVAFLLRSASVATNTTHRSLWIVAPGFEAKKLLDEAPIGPVEWASDSNSLIARLARPEKAAFWRVALDGSPPRPVFEYPNRLGSAWWSADLTQVLFTSAEPLSAEARKRPEREGVLYDESVFGIRSFTRGAWLPSVKPALWYCRVGMKSAESVTADLSAIGSIGGIVW